MVEHYIGGEWVASRQTFETISPIDEQVIDEVARADAGDVDRAVNAAHEAFPAWAALGPAGRAEHLHALADLIDANVERLAQVECRDMAMLLGSLRTRVIKRGALNFRNYADLAARYEERDWRSRGTWNRVQRMPSGPAAVITPWNAPFMLSTWKIAPALAAGSTVVLKPAEWSPLSAAVLGELAGEAGIPPGVLNIVQGIGEEAGAALVAHPAVKAVGFTGSLAGGRALVSIINDRPDPIPFYGELSSLNPVVVTPAAATERAEDVGRGLVGSFTMGGGQFCTKPGLVYVPSGEDGDAVVRAMAAALGDVGTQWLLNERIAQAYDEGTEALRSLPGVDVVAGGADDRAEGFPAAPLLLSAPAGKLTSELSEEVFGPVAVVARYDDEQQLMDSLTSLPSSLTATVHSGDGETELPGAVTSLLRNRTGRFVYNGYPTGVAVSWAQHHGGPWPSTNTAFTSVGASSIRRFLRPLAWQAAPEAVLPPELRDGGTPVPRRVDGVLVLP
jgi:NADP-dependent aldehyde dehydrogenase